MAGSSERLAVGDSRIDMVTREAWAGERLLRLTGVEFSLLETFVREAGRVVTSEQLTERVLGRNSAFLSSCALKRAMRLPGTECLCLKRRNIWTI